MTSWRTDLGGSAQFPKAVPPGSIFGANLGAATGELYLQSVSDDLRRLAETELGRAGQKPDMVAPKTLVPSGETRDIHRAGEDTSPWSAAIRCSICRKTAGRMRSIRTR